MIVLGVDDKFKVNIHFSSYFHILSNSEKYSKFHTSTKENACMNFVTYCSSQHFS